MKATNIIFSFLVIAIIGLIALHLHVNPFQQYAVKDDNENSGTTIQLSDIIKVQNETINLLEGVLLDKVKLPKLLNLLVSDREKDKKIASLISQLQQLQSELNSKDKTSGVFPRFTESHKDSRTMNSAVNVCNSTSFLIPVAEGLQKECSAKYGMELVDEWKKGGEVWCESEEGGPGTLRSRLTCYPYHQAHKRLDGRGADLFCEAENFLVDFAKVHGASSSSKPPRGDQYLSFDQGSLLATCKKTKHYKPHQFMPHNQAQMSSFQDGATLPPSGSYTEQHTHTYLLARDEDCENSFHSTADFMNMFLVMSALGIKPQNQQVMLFDKHTDGPYLELVQKAFSPAHPVIRHQHYKRGKVLFERLVFHLESPAGLIFPKVSRPDPLRCYDTGLFQGYRKFVLNAFGLLHVAPPAIPTVTLSLRQRTPQKNVGRVLKNEEEVVKVLKEANMMHVNVVDTAKMSFSEQLSLIRGTNILVGVHGAGLMFIMFAAEEAILVEVHPSYRQDRHFRHAARMTGKIYMPLRSQTRETCVGSSDDVTVPVGEFRALMDGAVRIARSFDDGLSECGMLCPPSILALDSRLDPLYRDLKMVKGNPINTQFPCY